jgi:hypothetical protein
MRRRGHDGCQFIWVRRSGEALFCGREGEVVHVELNRPSCGMPVLPFAKEMAEGDFVLCRSHVRWLERDGAEISE